VVSGAWSVQRIGERIIRSSCRRFPADVGADRYREWTAELSAILDDASIRSSLRRALRALAFSAGVARTTRQLSRPARAGARQARSEQWRAGATRMRPGEMAVRVAVGLAVWLVVVAGLIAVITALRNGSRSDVWPLLVVVPLGIGFDAYCLRDIVRAADVRYLRKWVWALICLAQMPLGGILYLAIGRIGPAQPVPPSAP
jgi:Phospholipase_D-nuclease N-terminal